MVQGQKTGEEGIHPMDVLAPYAWRPLSIEQLGSRGTPSDRSVQQSKYIDLSTLAFTWCLDSSFRETKLPPKLIVLAVFVDFFNRAFSIFPSRLSHLFILDRRLLGVFYQLIFIPGYPPRSFHQVMILYLTPDHFGGESEQVLVGIGLFIPAKGLE